MKIYRVLKLLETRKATFHIGRDNDGVMRTEYEFYKSEEDAKRRAAYLEQCAHELGVESSFIVSEIEVK